MIVFQTLRIKSNPGMIFSLVVMLAWGFLLFSSEAMRMYFNLAFPFKMVCLLVALVFTFTLYRKLMTAEQSQVSPRKLKLAALLSITLWSGRSPDGLSATHAKFARPTFIPGDHDTSYFAAGGGEVDAGAKSD